MFFASCSPDSIKNGGHLWFQRLSDPEPTPAFSGLVMAMSVLKSTQASYGTFNQLPATACLLPRALFPDKSATPQDTSLTWPHRGLSFTIHVSCRSAHSRICKDPFTSWASAPSQLQSNFSGWGGVRAWLSFHGNGSWRYYPKTLSLKKKKIFFWTVNYMLGWNRMAVVLIISFFPFQFHS